MTQRKPRLRRRSKAQRADRANPIIGYVARVGQVMICTGDACIVTGSRANMKQWLSRFFSRDIRHVTIEPTCLDHLLYGIHLGGAYDFDQEAYERFRPHAVRRGIALARQPFREGGGFHNELVRVQWGLLSDMPPADSMAFGSGRSAASPWPY